MVAARTTTVTLTWNQPPRVLTEGLSYRAFKVSDAAFHGTVSSTILLAKLPPVCEILGAFIHGTNADVTGAVMVLRAGATDISVSFTSGSLATPAGDAGSNISTRPVRLSLSDDAAVQYAALRLECTTASTLTTTLSLAGWVVYSVGSNDLG